MPETLVKLESLTKRYGSSRTGGILAVDNVSFDVSPGEVMGFLGPNGAGKSTTMKMLTGYLPPTSGRAHVCGFDVTSDPISVKKRVGYLPEGSPLYAEMTPIQFLRFVADVRGLRGGSATSAIDKAVALTHIEGVLHQTIDTLSKGFKRRVGLAQAIVHAPRVLILDEPTDGLDPNQKHEVRQLIRAMAQTGGESGKAIILSTHILEEVEAVCTRAVIIARGRLVADERPEALMARSRYHNAVSLALCPPAGTMIFDELRKIPGVREVEDHGTHATSDGKQVRCTVIPRKGSLIAPEISHLIKARSWQVDSMRVEAGRLDDVFRDLTTVQDNA